MLKEKTVFDTLKELNFKPLSDFSPKQQKLLFHYLPEDNELVIYAKVVEQLIEFSDNTNHPLWKTHFCIASFVVFKNNVLFDKFVAPLKIFRVRNAYESDTVSDIFENLLSELDLLDDYISEEEQDYGYEA